MNIDIELVAGTPGDVALIDVCTHGNQESWFYDQDSETEASKEMTSELRKIGAQLPKHAITCQVNREDGERLVARRVGFLIAVKLAKQQGFTVGHLEESIKPMEGEYPARYLVGEVRRGMKRYEVFVTSSGRQWEVFEAEIDAPPSPSTGRAVARAKRLPLAVGLGREYVMAHGARERRRILPRVPRRRKATSRV